MTRKDLVGSNYDNILAVKPINFSFILFIDLLLDLSYSCKYDLNIL